MTAVLLQPHSDDAALFAAYLCCKHKPHVITVFRSQVQEDRGTGITQAMRYAEDEAALRELGLDEYGYLAGGPGLEQWDFSDDEEDFQRVSAAIRSLTLTFDLCIAPVNEEGEGHLHHDVVGNCATAWFGVERTVRYLTYTRTAGRSTWGTEVVPEPEWIERKLRALACYSSQIREPSTRPWFYNQLDMREWVA